MRLASLVGFGSFVLVSSAVGLRLLLLARQTRQVPELAIGLALFAGGTGYMLIMLVMGVRVLAGTPGAVALFAGSACTAIGATSLALGIRRIFRPGGTASLALIAALGFAMAATLVGRALDPYRIPSAAWIFWTATLASTVIYLWSACESLAYWKRMQRRLRIGLADAETTRRFLLWGVSAGAAVGMHVASMVSRAIVGPSRPPEWLMATTSACGLVAALGIWLAFFPRRRQAVAADAESMPS